MSEHISQAKAIIAYLRQGYGITSLEAVCLFNCLNLKGRIYEARRDGWGIRTTMIKTRMGKRIAQYTLTDTQQEQPAPDKSQQTKGRLAVIEHEIEHIRAGKEFKEGARWVLERLKNAQ